MKLHCPVCKTSFEAKLGHLVCPKTTAKHVHPLQKKFENSDPVLLEDAWSERWNAGENSYSIFRECLGSFAMARQAGFEKDWLEFLQDLETNARKIHPAGFAPTPLVNTAKLSKQLGHRSGLYAKNETATILGSHKARHAISSLLFLESLRKLTNAAEKPPLAIFSCGNAALGAAAIAKSAGYCLYTFVPATLSQEIESLLSNMDARVVKVRREGSVGQGDPCNILYQQALRTFGWTAFSCYAHDLWASVEGAEILALELVVQIALEQTDPVRVALYGFDKAKLENMVLQVGGGGLANGVIAGLRKAVQLQLLEKMPRIYLAQTESCFPLAESYFAIVRRIAHEAQMGSEQVRKLLASESTQNLLRDHAQLANSLAHEIAANFSRPSVQNVLATVAANRGDFFKPWNVNEPHSIAEGILDDTTYDGFEITVAMLETGGIPCVLSESELAEAWKLGHESTKLNVSATGTAALAAIMLLQQQKVIRDTQNTAFIFTGVETRQSPPQINAKNVVNIAPGDSEMFESLPSVFQTHFNN